LDAVVTAVLAAMILVLLVEALAQWYAILSRGKEPVLQETPYVATQWAEGDWCKLFCGNFQLRREISGVACVNGAAIPPTNPIAPAPNASLRRSRSPPPSSTSSSSTANTLVPTAAAESTLRAPGPFRSPTTRRPRQKVSALSPYA